MTRTADRLRAAAPPPALVLLGILSVQVGAGMAKQLFDRLAPSAVVSLRLLVLAIVVGVAARAALPAALRERSRRDLLAPVGLGLALAGMNLTTYQALARIPLGVTVTIAFLGPLVVASVSSRRPRDLLWPVLAFAGVALLARGDGDINVAGIAFALLAAAGWGAYIVLTAATGRRFAGATGLALASFVGAVVTLPVGVAAGGTALLDPVLLAVGLAVGVLSSVIPYTLEMAALRRMSKRVFGTLMSLEPAVAVLVGMILLGEILSARQWIAVACVVIACVGATRGEPPDNDARASAT